MSAKVEVKREPKWRGWLRRWFRPKSYWQKRLDDRLDDWGEDEDEASALSDLGRSAWKVGTGLVHDLTSAWFTMLASAVVMALALRVTAWVFLSPGFFENGLADPIGRGLASVCAATGQCHLGVLLWGIVFVVLFAVSSVLVLWAAMQMDDDDDDDEEDPLLDPLRVLDERLVHLRADLVLAGVLPLSPEEKADLPDEWVAATPAEKVAHYRMLATQFDVLADKIEKDAATSEVNE